MKLNTKEIILTALFAALTAIGAFLVIPTHPVPITLQIVFAMYAGVLLGSKLAFASQLVYVLIGLLGLPVFAGGTGGFQYVLSPTFGYLLGFILAAAVIGKITENISNFNGIMGIVKLSFATIVGLGVVYLVGVPYLYMIFNLYLGNPIDFNTALIYGFYPFILQDLIKCFVVSVTAYKVIPALERGGFIRKTTKVYE